MDIAGPATNVTSEAANRALLARGMPGGGAATQAILGRSAESPGPAGAGFQRLERALGRLLNEPWNTARLYLTEAHQPGRDPEQVRAYLT